MTDPEPYEVAFSPAARRGLAKLPLAAATALVEHSSPDRMAKGHPERTRTEPQIEPSG
jgi:hypothetical protein